jgi:hypothetical protein
MVEKDCNTLLDDYERVATLECGDKVGNKDLLKNISAAAFSC